MTTAETLIALGQGKKVLPIEWVPEAYIQLVDDVLVANDGDKIGWGILCHKFRLYTEPKKQVPAWPVKWKRGNHWYVDNAFYTEKEFKAQDLAADIIHAKELTPIMVDEGG